LIERIDLIPGVEFSHAIDKAEEIMKEIAPKDSPFLAVGIAKKAEGIWSEDRDFDKQDVLRKYSTKDMIGIITRDL
jgi:predicted nucleic acid-binding protein